MIRVLNKNPIEIAFYDWITNNPKTFHHTDVNRFYTFVFTALNFKAGLAFINKKFFYNKCCSYNLYDKKIINAYYLRLLHVAEIDNCIGNRVKRSSIISSDDISIVYRQKTIIDNKMYIVNITQNEFEHNGISMKEVLNRNK